VIPAPLTQDPCTLAPAWGISVHLARKLNAVALDVERAGLGLLTIISGFRTCEHQAELDSQGRPAAPCNLSTHTTCPATGADVWAAAVDSSERTDGVKLALITIAERHGLRVGGGGPVKANGIPVDWNHWDLGPRQQGRA